MKVAIIGRYRQHSSNGVDRTISGHVSQLIRLKHNVTLMTFDQLDDAGLSFLERLGVSDVIVLEKNLRWLRTFFNHRRDFDLVCLHSVFTPYNWAASILFKCAWIVTPNGGYSAGQLVYKRRFLKKLALMLFEKRMLTKALFVHALSINEVNQIKNIAPNAATRIAPNGCKPIQKLRKNKIPTDTEKIRLLYIGRLSIMHKGLDLMIDALGALDSNLKWFLDIVGPGSVAEQEELQRMILELGLTEQVALHGALYGDDKARLLKACDVFVHTSRWEGMPFAVVEALQHGIPVLITSETNMEELILDYEAGWVCQAETITETLEGILKLSKSQISKKSYGVSNLVNERLNWNHIGNLLFDDLEDPNESA